MVNQNLSFDEMLRQARGAPSRLAPAPTGADINTHQPSTPLEGLGRLASFATSGQDFIKTTTGFDINTLPGVISKPLDFIANPVGIASLLAAIPSGGTSLAALGARGVAARLAGAAVKDVAGGLVGTEVGKIAADMAPGPDWLKAGIGLGAGVLAGGKTAGTVGRRLPAAFDAAHVSTSVAQDEAIRLNKKTGGMRGDPLNLEDADLELNKVQQISSVIKAFAGMGVQANKLTTPILDQAQAGMRTAGEQLKLIQSKWDLLKRADQMGIVDTDSATMIKVLNKAKGEEDLIPLADAAAHPSLYELNKVQDDSLRALSRELTSYHKAYRGAGGRIGIRTDIEQGGFYLPRGVLDEFPGMPYATKRGLLANPDAARAAQFTSQAEGIANGIKYPKFEDALKDYVTGMSSALVGRNAANQLAKIPGLDGHPVLRSIEEMVPQTISKSYLSAESKSYGLDFKLKNAESDLQTALNQRATLESGSFLNTGSAKATLDQKITDLGQLVTDIKAEQANHAPVMESVRNVYAEELAKIKRDPTLGSLEPTNLPDWMAARGDKYYGPKEITDAINAQLNPSGLYESGRRVSNSLSNHLRLFHTVADLSDFGRLASTAGLTHPFDFFKGIQTGFKTLFSPSALAQDFKGVDTELRANGIDASVKDFIKYGNMPMSNLDLDIGVLRNLPGGNFLAKVSNVTTNGITSFRAHMIKTELLNMKGAGQMIGPAEIEQAVKNIKLVSGASIHAPLKGADMFIQFPNWLQSQFEFVGHSAMGLPALTGLTSASPESKFAAKAMLRLVGLGLSATYAANAMGGHPTEFNNGVPMMRVGDKKIDIFGPYGALARGMYAGLKGDPEALIRSRVSPLFQIGWDLGTGHTFIGDTASFDDPEYWATAFAPYSISGSQYKQGPEITLLQGAGIRANRINSFNLLREQAQETMGTDWVDLSGNQKEQLRRANPELVAQLEKATQDKAAQGDKYALAALENEKINNNLLDQQQTLNHLVQIGNISPRQLRDGLSNISQAAAERKQQIRSDYKLDSATKEPTANQSALNNYFDLFTQADSGILEGGVKTGIVDWDTFDRLEAEFMKTLTPTQQKAVTDKFVRRDPSLDWYYANKNVIQESGYFDAVDVAFNRIKPQVQAYDKGIDTYSDLRKAYYEAQKNNDRVAFIRTDALLQQTSKHLQLMRAQLLRQNPVLYKALVQNGYTEQAKSKQLAANIQ